MRAALETARLSPTLPARASGSARARAFWELTKPGIGAVVLMTTAAGFAAVGEGPLRWGLLAWTLLGTWLSACGAGALNMLLERDSDALMGRTARRPLPSGRLRAEEAMLVGTATAILGVGTLTLAAHPLAGLLSASCLFLYLGLYTPLKRVSPLCMVPGAASGAIPPLIGWAAAHGTLSPPGWTLALVLFLWQFPHIMALSWLYRKDYARAGLRMLPEHRGLEDATAAGLYAVTSCLALVPASLLPVAWGSASGLYAWTAGGLGLVYLFASAAFALTRTETAARRLFLASILYVPLLLAALLFAR